MTAECSTLENGFRIVTQTVPHVETLSLGIWVNVGSRYEPKKLNGISHLLEHMAFKGTQSRSAQQIALEIESVGGYLNAHTSREHTAYTARLLKEDLELGIDILSDILQNPTFHEEELEKEKEVVCQEIFQSYDTPDDIIFDYYKEVAYPNQALGRSILGTLESVKGISQEDLRNYMKNYYIPSQCVLSVVGNIKHDQVLNLAKKYLTLNPIKNSDETLPLDYKGGERLISRDLEQVHMVLGFPSFAYGSEGFYRSSVLSVILSGGMSSRLFQEIREKRGLVYTISTFNTPYKDGGLFNLYAGTSQDHMEELLPVIKSELDRTKKDIQEEELSRCRAQFKASLLMGMESLSARCEQLASHILHYNRVLSMEEIIAKIDAIKVSDIYHTTEEMFTQPYTFAAIGDVKTIPNLSSIF